MSDIVHDSTCGHCGRTWSSYETPTPAARCPYEHEHEYPTYRIPKPIFYIVGHTDSCTRLAICPAGGVRLGLHLHPPQPRRRALLHRRLRRHRHPLNWSPDMKNDDDNALAHIRMLLTIIVTIGVCVLLWIAWIGPAVKHDRAQSDQFERCIQSYTGC